SQIIEGSSNFARGQRGPRRALRLERRPVVQLAHPQPARRGRLHAQLAEDALVEVLLHDLDPALPRGEDVHGAGLLELPGELGVSSMKRPAMNATIGSRDSFSVTQCASSASMRPPGSE